VIFFFIFAILLIFLLNSFFIRYNFLLDKKVLPHKSFASNEKIPLTGGFLVIANLFFFYSKDYLIFFLLIFFLGIFSDLLVIKNPLKKIILQLVIIFLFIFLSNLRIFSTKIFFIDLLIKNNFFSIIFITFCLLILINGSNFLDGLNTLVAGYYMLVVLAILYLGIQYKINYNFYFFIYLFFSLLIIFVFNFLSKVYLGDAGVFLLSFIIGYELIQISNLNSHPNLQFVSPIFIVLLLWYPAFENLFSIIRKSYNRINPAQPDNKHLHHLLFFFIKNKIVDNRYTNSFSANIINFYNLIIFIIGSNYFSNTKYLSYLLLINILIYSICYYILLKTNKVNK
jgi:UDP-N-acetylmuramyl pentapeptide phosphotransferase/UDP-N-acetylglucosamine-1-phosphate transferase